jgi:hypothetical protein
VCEREARQRECVGARRGRERGKGETAFLGHSFSKGMTGFQRTFKNAVSSTLFKYCKSVQTGNSHVLATGMWEGTNDSGPTPALDLAMGEQGAGKIVATGVARGRECGRCHARAKTDERKEVAHRRDRRKNRLTAGLQAQHAVPVASCMHGLSDKH